MVQTLVAVAVMLPVLVAEAGLDPGRWPWLAGVLAVAAVIARVMASPTVEGMLAVWVPWLAKQTPGRHEAGPDPDPDTDEAARLVRRQQIGAARPSALSAAVAASVLALTTAPLAGNAQAHPPQVAVRITSACDSALEDAGDRTGDTWTSITFTAVRGRVPLLDDQTARLQVWDVSRQLHGGRWVTFRQFGDDGVPDPGDLLVSGGEGTLRFDESGYAAQGGRARQYRVQFAGGTSPEISADAELGCEP